MGKTLGGLYTVRWRTEPDEIPLNAPFTVELRLGRADGSELPDTTKVVVDATMPAHHHGMNRAPRIESDDPSVWHARGMLFHMPGDWEVTIDVFERGVSERAVFEVELEP